MAWSMPGYVETRYCGTIYHNDAGIGDGDGGEEQKEEEEEAKEKAESTLQERKDQIRQGLYTPGSTVWLVLTA